MENINIKMKLISVNVHDFVLLKILLYLLRMDHHVLILSLRSLFLVHLTQLTQLSAQPAYVSTIYYKNK
jgi:hypothetical protein